MCSSAEDLLVLFFFSLLLPSLELSDAKVFEPQIRALLGTASHFCEVVVRPSGCEPLISHFSPSNVGPSSNMSYCFIDIASTSHKDHMYSGSSCAPPPRTFWYTSQFKNINVKRFRGGLVFKAHGRVYHSTLGLRVIQKKKDLLVASPSFNIASPSSDIANTDSVRNTIMCCLQVELRFLCLDIASQ